MTGATPRWGTLVVAALALVGVLWAQWRADRRERERIGRERAERDRDRRFGLYGDIVLSFDEVQRALRTAADGLDASKRDQLLRQYGSALSTATLLAPPEVRERLDKVVVGWYVVLKVYGQQGVSSRAFATALSAVDDLMSELVVAMRADVGAGL